MRETTFMGSKVTKFEEVTALNEVISMYAEANGRDMARAELLRCFRFFKANDDDSKTSKFDLPELIVNKPFTFMGKEVNSYLEVYAIYHELMPKEAPKAYLDAKTPKQREMAIRNIPEVKHYAELLIALNSGLRRAKSFYFDFEKLKSL